MSAVFGVGCWFALLVGLLVRARRVEMRRRQRVWLEHKNRVREYEFLTTRERVRYPLAAVPRRIPPKHLATCNSIWMATLERERLDREEWKRAAS